MIPRTIQFASNFLFMNNLIFIHGGESFANETKYQKFLRETYIDWQTVPWSPEIKTSWVQEIAKKWYSE